MDRWVRTDEEHRAADSQPTRPSRTTKPPRPLPPEVAAEIRRAADVATTHHREVLVSRVEEAAAAYERGRYQEAARIAKAVSNEVPGVAAVREIAGLGAYRSGRWREAVRQLYAHRQLSGEIEHVPALMDCRRALGQWRRVGELWSDLRHHSPGPDVLAEARIVAAGSLADQHRLDEAIAVLAGSGAARPLRNPSDRHLRQWYALADLYERAGDLPQARELFLRVSRADPEAYDVADRLRALGPPRPRKNRKRPASPVSKKDLPSPPR